MKLFIGIVVALVLAHFGNLAYDAGIFVEITPTKNDCEKMAGIHGPEDMAIVDHHLFISSTYLPLRYEFKVGNLYYVNLAKAEFKLIPLLTKNDNLSPHGIHAHRTKNGEVRIWAVNHYQGNDTVEVYDFNEEAQTLDKIKTIKSQYYINGNDLVAIDDERFFMTHDHGSLNEFYRTFENFSRIGFGFVTFYDGKEVSIAESGFTFPNGIIKDGNHLYMAQMLAKKLVRFTLDESGKLILDKTINLPYPPDNISLHNGDIYIATHPKIFALKAHALDGKEISPSTILKYNIKTDNIQSIFSDDGNLISASSVAQRYGEKLFIGNIYSNHILRCN